jgi:hypothetical protein
MMKYQQAENISKDGLVSTIKGGDQSAICRALLDAVEFIPDQSWLEDICINLSSYEDESIVRLSITCMGHLGRIYGGVNSQVLERLDALSRDERFVGVTEDAISDIRMFSK